MSPTTVTVSWVASITQIAQVPAGLQVWTAGDTEPLTVPWFWIKDHSQDPSAFDAHTSQRLFDSFALDVDETLEPAAVTLIDEEVRVEWSDGTPPSVLPASVFSAIAYGEEGLRPGPSYGPAELWSSPDDLTSVATPFAELAGRQTSGLDAILGDMERFGFALVSEMQADEAGTEALANAIGYVRRTIFGDIWPLSSEITDHADSAYGHSALEPHTDGSYSYDGPGLQLFVCAERTGEGGESVLVDGFAIAETLRTSNPEAFELLTTVSVPAHYKEEGVDLRASRPTIRLEGRRVAQVTFNNYDRSPMLLEPDLMRRWYKAYAAFHELIIDQSRWWVGRLEPGDALIFDNWRCLHGRQAYTGRRSFFGCYLNHEDLESRLRVRGCQLRAPE